MVNNQNPYLVLHPTIPPPPANEDADRDRSIGSSALWNLQELIEIVCNGTEDSFDLVTDRATHGYEDLVENGFDLRETFAKLATQGRFKGAFWCKTSPAKDSCGRPRGTGTWLPCDAYTINDDYYNPTNDYRGKATYYFKMAKALDGSTVLFVSCHV